MRVSESQLKKMPAELQAMFHKLPNPGSEKVVELFPQTSSGKQAKGGHRRNSDKHRNTYAPFAGQRCEGDVLYGDSGSAARFYYCAKASRQDRDEGLDGMDEKPCGMMEDDNYPIKTGNRDLQETKRRNTHATVKPTALMRYLCRLVTPPGGVVLDQFMGSGSTGKAALPEGFRFIGIENEAESFEIAFRRISHAEKQIDQGERQGQLFKPKQQMEQMVL